MSRRNQQDGRTRTRGDETTRLAADGLEAILAALAPTGSAKDERIREAMAAAARALREGQEPMAAAGRVYAAADRRTRVPE